MAKDLNKRLLNWVPVIFSTSGFQNIKVEQVCDINILATQCIFLIIDIDINSHFEIGSPQQNKLHSI